MAIKILRRGLPRLGIVKVGRLNYDKPFRGKDGKTHFPPVKDDHFTAYTTEKDDAGRPVVDEALMQALGPRPTELDVVLPFDDPELCFRTELAYYRGGTRFCHGDGEAGFRLQERGKQNNDLPVYGERKPHGPCGEGCPDLQSRRCKPSGVLAFLLREQAFVGGVYEFRTHGWRSVANIEESIKAIRLVTGGLLAWIPLKLRVQIETVQPKDGGAAQLAPIVRLYFPGSPVQLLQEKKKLLELQAPLQAEIRRLEDGLRGIPVPEPTREEAEEIEEEFYTEANTDPAPVTAAFDIQPPQRKTRKAKPNNEPAPEPEDDAPPADSYETAPPDDPDALEPCPVLISEGERQRLRVIAAEFKVPTRLTHSLVAAYGFGSTSEITKDKVTEIGAWLEQGPEGVKKRIDQLKGGELPLR